MIIFKKQDLHLLFESMRDRMITNVSNRKNLAVRRRQKVATTVHDSDSYWG